MFSDDKKYVRPGDFYACQSKLFPSLRGIGPIDRSAPYRVCCLRESKRHIPQEKYIPGDMPDFLWLNGY